MQELFTNQSEELALSLIYNAFLGDRSIESKYNMLTKQGYKLTNFTVCENLRASRNLYPIYMLNTVYHFKNDSGEEAEIVVDPLGRMYKGSFAMFQRFAKFEESQIYGSGEYQEFLAFSPKCLDAIMKIPAITKNNDISLYRELKNLNGSIAKAFSLLFFGEDNLPLWFDTPSKKVSYKEKEGVRNLLLTMARAQFVEKYLISSEAFDGFLEDSIYTGEGKYNNRALDIIDVLDIPLHEYDQSNVAKGILGFALDNCSDNSIKTLFSNGIDENDLSLEVSNTIKEVIIEHFNDISNELLIKTIKQLVNTAILLSSDNNIKDIQSTIKNFALSQINKNISSIKVKQPGVFDNLVPELTYKDVCNLILTGKNIKDTDRTRILSGLVLSEDKQSYINSHSQDFFAIFCTNIKDMFRIYGKIKDDEAFDKKATKLICNRYTVQNVDTDTIPPKYQEMYERLIPVNETKKHIETSTLEKLLMDENSDDVERELIESLLGTNN